MKLFHFILATPERKIFDREIVQATLPVVDGEVTVLAEHVPYIAALKAGEMRLVDEVGKEENIAISSGFLEFGNNVLTVLADTAELAHEIDIERAQKAIERAEKAKQEKQVDDLEYATVAAQLEKELARLRVARKRK